MTPAVIIGIDPGKTGAIACITADTAQLLWVEDMADTGPVGVGAHLAELLANEQATAVVERVSSSPQMGVTSAFTFGAGYGAILGALGVLGVPCTTVTPAKWKGALGLNRDKGLSRTRATQQWPEMAASFRRVKDDGRAEAALIALWAWGVR